MVRRAVEREGLPERARVASLFRNSPHYLAVSFGVVAADCVHVGLNPQERATALARQLRHCGATLLIGDADHPEWAVLREAALEGGIAVFDLRLTYSGALAVLASELKPRPARRANGVARSESDTIPPRDLATIAYTSGTTAAPKGVMLSHGNQCSNARAIIEYLGLTRSDRGFCVLPLQFSYGASVAHSHLLAGACLSLEETFAYPRVVLQRMQDEAVTGFAGVASTFALLLRHSLEDFDLSRLRYVTQAGGPMPSGLLQRLVEALPSTDIYVMYGQTEATARLSFLPPRRLADKPNSVGIPIPGVELDVRSSDRSLAPGEFGEICARGPNVMIGYWNDEPASARVLRDGWLHTGDLGYRDDEGFFFVRARETDMIKVGAFRVSPYEIEEVIGAIAGVDEVAVTSVADDVNGEAIIAFVIPQQGAALDERTIKAHCRSQLAAYKVPKRVQLATAFPRTSSGKLQRFKLVEMQ
jgi:acyl-CoA synthetase (AMP-forming)/AMP-acid ligase II